MPRSEFGPRLIISAEDYPLIKGQRTTEMNRVIDLLNVTSVVFIWGRAGNGKTGFARELAEDLPWKTQFVHPERGNSPRLPRRRPQELYDVTVADETKVLVFDEFEAKVHNVEKLIEDIESKIEEGRKFVFFMHHPESQLIEWKRYKKPMIPHVVKLIENHPDAPWFYLRKFK